MKKKTVSENASRPIVGKAVINIERPVNLFVVSIYFPGATSAERLDFATRLAVIAQELDDRPGCYPETSGEGTNSRVSMRFYMNQVGGREAQLESLEFIRESLTELGFDAVFNGLDEAGSEMISILMDRVG